MKTSVTVILVAAGMLACGTVGWFVKDKSMSMKERAISTATVTEHHDLRVETVETVLEKASELTALKYNYKNIAEFENTKKAFGTDIPFTTNQYLYTYSGIVNMGVKLSDVKYEIDNDKKIIKINLPPVRVLSHEIDESSYKFYSVKDSIFNDNEPEDFTRQRDTEKKEIEMQIRDDKDFMANVKDHVEDVIKAFLTASDSTKSYKVEFVDDESALKSESSTAESSANESSSAVN